MAASPEAEAVMAGKPDARQMNCDSQVIAGRKLAASCRPLSPAMKQEMKDRDPKFDRVTSGVLRKN